MTDYVPRFYFVPPDEITNAINQLINDINVQFGAFVQAGAGNFVGAWLVTNLPVGSNGQMAYAINGIKIGETTGGGTGVLVYFSDAAWRNMSNDYPVSA